MGGAIRSRKQKPPLARLAVSEHEALLTPQRATARNHPWPSVLLAERVDLNGQDRMRHNGEGGPGRFRPLESRASLKAVVGPGISC
jgi:hypothetical protein